VESTHTLTHSQEKETAALYQVVDSEKVNEKYESDTALAALGHLAAFALVFHSGHRCRLGLVWKLSYSQKVTTSETCIQHLASGQRISGHLDSDVGLAGDGNALLLCHFD